MNAATTTKPYQGACLACGGAQITYNPTTRRNDLCGECGGDGYHHEPPTQEERERMEKEARFFASST